MDASALSVLADCTAATGFVLSGEQRAALQLSLGKLKRLYKFTQVLFWGRVEGVENDYLLAGGVEENALTRRYFVSDDDGVTFKEMQPVSSADAQRAARVSGAFAGRLDAKYKIKETVPLDVPPPAPKSAAVAKEFAEGDGEGDAAAAAADGEGGEPAAPATSEARDVELSEERRLAALVAAIDADSALAPVGAYVLNAAHVVQRNPAFAGLALASVNDLRSYVHLRQPRAHAPRTQLQREQEGLLPNADFLDSADADKPAGVWSSVYEPATNTVYLRSLLWPGQHCFHVVGTPYYGCVYSGRGEKNVDLHFML